MAEPDKIIQKVQGQRVESNSNASSQSTVFKVFEEQRMPLKAFISRLIRKPQDIDDIAQETFVRAFLAEQKGAIQHPKAYLYRIARNLAFEILSKKSNLLTSYIEDSSDNSLLQSGEDIEGTAIVMEKFDRVKVAIAEMPPQC